MQEKTHTEQLDEIIDNLIGQRSPLSYRGTLSNILPRLDVSRPNIHDSKKEFLRERDIVEATFEHLRAIVGQVTKTKEDVEHGEMLLRLSTAIDIGATKSMRSKQVGSASDLALRNITQTGFFYSSLFVVIEMINVYEKRLRELDDQEKLFWNVSNRPPKYYARTIAVRLARLFAKEKRQKPTFGIARDGNHPSTDFGRALEEVFSVLGIKASVRNAAEWAIGQLTDDDIKPPMNALRGGLLAAVGGFPPTKPGHKSALERISDELKKGR